MKRTKAEVKGLVNSMAREELADMVIKLAANKEIYKYLSVHFFDQQSGEIDLFNEAIHDLDVLFCKRYKGYAE